MIRELGRSMDVCSELRAVLGASINLEGALERRRPVGVRDWFLVLVGVFVEHDGRARKMVVLVVVHVVVGYGEGGQAVKFLAAVGADEFGGAEGVGEDGGAADGRVADAVEELEAGGGLEVEEVHVEAEVEGGVAEDS